MKYQGIEVTLKNYEDIFEDFTSDIKDVIYVCLLQDIDISRYVDYCRQDPFRLWQIKYCIQEGFPKDIFLRIPYGSILYKIRALNREGIDVDKLLVYLKPNQSETLMNKIMEWFLNGYDISKYDFDLVNEDTLDVYDLGYQKGLDMSVFANKGYSHDELMAFITLLQNKKSIYNFMTEKWSNDVLKFLAELSYDSVYDKIIGFIDKDTELERVGIIVEAYYAGLPLKIVTAKSSDGSFSRTNDDIEKRIIAVKSGLPVREAVDANFTGNVIKAKGLVALNNIKRRKVLGGQNGHK